MRWLQRCQQLLRGACLAAEEGSAFSPSAIRHWDSALRQLGGSDGCFRDGGDVLWREPRRASQASRSLYPSISDPFLAVGADLMPPAYPWALSQARGLFGVRQKAPPNPQIHTHDAFKRTYPQPIYEWMLGRFVMDRNGTIWHRQANYRHQRHCKSASQLTRLKRWKPLHKAFAAKLIKVGFREKYWSPPDPQEVPGWHEPATGVRAVYKPLRRRSAAPALNQSFGDPALRQSWKPPPRQRIR